MDAQPTCRCPLAPPWRWPLPPPACRRRIVPGSNVGNVGTRARIPIFLSLLFHSPGAAAHICPARARPNIANITTCARLHHLAAKAVPSAPIANVISRLSAGDRSRPDTRKKSHMSPGFDAPSGATQAMQGLVQPGDMQRPDGCATGLRHWRSTGAVARRPVAGKVCASAPLTKPMPAGPLGGMGQWRSGADRTGGAAARDHRPVSKHWRPFSGAAVAHGITENRA